MQYSDNIVTLLAGSGSHAKTNGVSHTCKELDRITRNSKDLTLADYLEQVSDALQDASTLNNLELERAVLKALAKSIELYEKDMTQPFSLQSFRKLYSHIRFADVHDTLPLMNGLISIGQTPLAMQLAQTISDSTEELYAKSISQSGQDATKLGHVVRAVAVAQFDERRLSEAFSAYLNADVAMKLLEIFMQMLENALDGEDAGQTSFLLSTFEVNASLRLLSILLDSHYMTFVSSSDARYMLKRLQSIAELHAEVTRDLRDLKRRVEALTVVRKGIKQEQNGKSKRRLRYEQSLAMPDYSVEIIHL